MAEITQERVNKALVALVLRRRPTIFPMRVQPVMPGPSIPPRWLKLVPVYPVPEVIEPGDEFLASYYIVLNNQYIAHPEFLFKNVTSEAIPSDRFIGQAISMMEKHIERDILNSPED